MATRIHVVFYSMYGHVYRLAETVAEGAREVEGSEVALVWLIRSTPVSSHEPRRRQPLPRREPAAQPTARVAGWPFLKYPFLSFVFDAPTPRFDFLVGR